MSTTVEQIKDRLDIIDVISAYVSLQRAGSAYKARCPFHSERTPSFSVSPTRQSYHCFGCGVHGDMFTFVQEIEGVDFKGALKILAEQAGVELVYERGEIKEQKDEKEQLFTAMHKASKWYQVQLTEHQEARAYLEKRGLAAETIARFEIGFAPHDWHAVGNALRVQGYSEDLLEKAGLLVRGEKGYYDRFRSRIMFPIRDTAGRVVAFSGRIFGPPADDEKNAKYINSPETELYNKSKVLFGFDMAKHTIRKRDFAILVEGQMDLLMTHQAGFTNAVAISGTALTPEHCAIVGRMSKNLILALDSDDAGIRAAGKSAQAALARGFDVKVARLPTGKDPADVLLHDGVDAWRDAVRTAKHVVEFLLDVYTETITDDMRKLQRVVELEVLPHIARIQSSIDQEHFVKLVAGRIGVSESSVFAALQQVQVTKDDTQTEVATVRTVNYQAQFDPLKTLTAIIAWQSQMSEPAIDISTITERVKSIAGEETYTQARSALTEADIGTIERLYATRDALQEVVAERLELLVQRNIRTKRLALTQQLRQAEQMGDSERVLELQQQILNLNRRLPTV